MLDTLDVIEHDPRVLQISTGLHSFDQVYPRSGPHLGVRALSRELVLLNVGPVATASEHGNAVHDPKSSNILERGDVVLNTWEAHIFPFLENRD
jgi:uncharacterized NAD(P)/FAD-binding protein YdhS